MNIRECKSVIERYRLPETEFMDWSQDQKDVMLREYYSLLEYQPYEFNPWSQGPQFCEALGIKENLLPVYREGFYNQHLDRLRELTGWAND